MRKKPKRRKQKPQAIKNLCPLCSAPVDLRTKAGKAATVLNGWRWHDRCLNTLVTVQSLCVAKATLAATVEEQPLDRELMELFARPYFGN